MSGRPNKDKDDDDKGSGSGLATGLFVAGGAIAVGYLASQLWSGFKNMNMESTSRGLQQGSPPPGPGPSRGNDFLYNDDAGPRKETRSNVQGSGKEQVPKEVKCVVCRISPKEIMVEPCNHTCICEDCAEKIEPSCPMCGRKIISMKPVYIS